MGRIDTNDTPKIDELILLSLTQAETVRRRLRRLNARLLVAGLVASAAATVVSGWTAAAGPVVGSGPVGWKLSCAAAAFFGFVTTVCVGVNQQLGLGERVGTAGECLARLKSLHVALAVGNRAPDEVSREYEEIVRSYPESC